MLALPGSDESMLPGSQRFIFSSYPHMTESRQQASEPSISSFKSTNPTDEGPPSRPNHHLKAQHLNTITLGVRTSSYEF